MKEGQIQKQILDYLKVCNYTHWRNFVGPIIQHGGKFRSKNPMAGLPDILGIFKTHHRLFAIEVKTKTGKISERQHIWINKLQDAGAFCMIARCLDDVIEAFEGVDNWEP
jgi:hypothetical protein